MNGSSPGYKPFPRRLRALPELLLLLCTLTQAQELRVKEYGLNSGLPQDYVYSMHQDAAGYLWIGTGEGLARFDGNVFEVFTQSDSLSSNFISCSYNEGMESWFGHNNGGITYYNGNEFSKLVPETPGAGSITDIKRNGNILWASTQSGGIWRIGPDQETRLLNDPEMPLQIFSMEFLSAKLVVLGSMDGAHVVSIDHESNILKYKSALEGIPDTKIQQLGKSHRDSSLFILTEDEGIFILNLIDFTSRPLVLESELSEGIEGQQQIFEDSRGNLWISTFGNGLYKLTLDDRGKYSTWTNYNDQNSLPGINVKLVFEDREKNLWLGMYGEGLVRLVDEAFSYYSFMEDEGANNIHAVYVTSDSLWIGSEKGLILYNRSGGEYILDYGRMHGLPEDRVTALAGASGQNLWIGTSQHGVFRLKSGEEVIENIPISSGILENSINSLALKDSVLWIATDKGVCSLNTRTGTPVWYTMNNAGLPHNTVNNLQVCDDGKIWLSTFSTSLLYIEQESVGKLLIPYLEAALNIRSVTQDQEGHFWIGTFGSGLFKLGKDSILHFHTENGLLSDFCNSVVSDGEDYIWVSHRGGLSRIRISDGFISKVQEEAGIEQNMEFNPNAVFKDQQGKLWFGSTSGVLEYNPQLEKHQPVPPALSLISLQVNNEARQLKNEIKLPPGRHTIKIEFIGINLENPDAVNYSYRMDGLDENWSQASPENQVTFTKLPEGQYTFRLLAYDGDGNVQKNPLELEIHISIPLWKRWWIQLLIILILSSGVLAIIKRREHNLLVIKQKLELTVRERTQEVVDQKEEIEGQRDAIQSQSEKIRLINQNITDSIHYASHIQRAVFTPPESLASVFPECFILSRPQYIVSGDFFWLAHEKEKHVFTVADCTGHGVPGAFMSMLGITLLNEIVNNHHCVEADKILNRLKDGIIHALRQTTDSETSSDGMDMALCVFDPVTSKLQFAGGFVPLILIRDGEYFKNKTDPMPVGIGAISGRVFTRHELKIQKGDQIYLYSDGYEDQFGGAEDTKFSRKRFRELLMEIHALPVKDQKARLEQCLEHWMGDAEQVDDIMVVGIRF